MVLVTGASSGIGEATAWKFAQEGHPLFLVARREDRLRSLSEEIRKKYQTAVGVAVLDVSDRKAVDSFKQQHAAELSRTTILVNNAGLAKGLDDIQHGKIDDWEQMIDTNIKGVLYLTRAVLDGMVENRRGHIIQIGSVAGHWVYPKGNIYCATKYAVNALTQAMRMDLVGKGIRVTEISPGMVETEFSLVRLEDGEKAKKVYAGMEPLKPSDVAEAVYWVASQPPHVNIQEIVMYPTDQASPMVVHRQV